MVCQSIRRICEYGLPFIEFSVVDLRLDVVTILMVSKYTVPLHVELGCTVRIDEVLLYLIIGCILQAAPIKVVARVDNECRR